MSQFSLKKKLFWRSTFGHHILIEVFFQSDYKKCLRKSVKLIDAEQLLSWVERTLRRSEPGVDLLRDYRF